MKKLFLSISIVSILFSILACGKSDKIPPDNGQNFTIIFEDKELKNQSITMGIGGMGLPVQELVEKLGYSITTFNDDKLVIDTGSTIEIMVSTGKILVDGEEKYLSTPAVKMGDIFYVEAPVLSEILGFDYTIENEIITITAKKLN